MGDKNVYKSAVRKKRKEEGHFDGRFWERSEEEPDPELTEEEAIELGLLEYYRQQEEEQEDHEEEEKEEYTEKVHFNPFEELRERA